MHAFLFLHAIRLITSFLYSSTACVHIYYVLALFCVHSYCASALSLCASLLHSSTDCVHSYFSSALPTFSPCAFLQYSSTADVNFYCIAALLACISVGFQYFLRAFPSRFSLYVFLWAVQCSGRLSLLALLACINIIDCFQPAS